MKDNATKAAPVQAAAYDAKYDILKFILSVCVVAIHTDLFPQILFPWLRIAVPLFFIITGMFLFEKLHGETEQKKRMKIVSRFVQRNLKLYFFWFLCLCPLILYIRKDIIFGGGLAMSGFALVKLILFGSTFTGSWYIMSGILGVLIISVLLKKVPTKMLFFSSLLLYVFLALTSSYGPMLRKNTAVAAFLDGYQTVFGVPTLTFPIAVVWLSCGKCFAENCFQIRKRTYIIICAVSAILLYMEWHVVRYLYGAIKNDCYLFLLPFCFGIFGWIHSSKAVYSPASIHLKRCSTVIYAMHGAVNRMDGAFYRRILHIDSPLLCFVTTCILCMGAYAVIVKLLRNKTNPVIRLLRHAY